MIIISRLVNTSKCDTQIDISFFLKSFHHNLIVFPNMIHPIESYMVFGNIPI